MASRVSGGLGDLSPYTHGQNTWNDLRPDLTFDDVLTIRGIDAKGSASGLLSLLGDFTAVSAVELSRSKLTGGLQAGFVWDIRSQSIRLER